MELKLKIPSSINMALRLPERDKTKVLLTELALTLYQRNILSFGKAMQLAELSKWKFHELLGKRKIDRHYDLESFKEDLSYGKA